MVRDEDLLECLICYGRAPVQDFVTRSHYQCPHNLFWRGLKFDMDRIDIVGKALRMRNCCRFISEPWTSEEIAESWELKKKEVK